MGNFTRPFAYPFEHSRADENAWPPTRRDDHRSGNRRELPIPDTGSLAGDLAELCRHGFEILDLLDDMGVLRGLLADAIAHPRIADRLRDELLAPDEERYRAIFERAAARGDLAIDPLVASQIVPPALAGFAIHRGLLTNREPTADQVATLVGVLAAGLAAGG